MDTIVWTFDPLVRRNARLNLIKLGADVDGFEVDFYGNMDDGINSGDPTAHQPPAEQASRKKPHQTHHSPK